MHLTSHLGARPVWNEAIAAFVPGALPKGMSVAGAANGRLGLADALETGARTGLEAAADCGFSGQPVDLPEVDPESTALTPLWRVRGTRGKAFVDFQNDVSDEDVALAGHEGFRAVEHLKRYTTLGMAADQGKTSNLTGLALMAEFTAKTIPQTGTTTFRPPFAPVAIGALAGTHRGKEFRPTRLPPSHRWAREQGAVFVETGAWLRAQWYPRAGETDWLESVNREVRTVRSSVGVCDVSTLGKIDLQGADAAEFLNRLYTNTWTTLAVGRARYGLMLREDGFVLDDGTTSRLAEDRFIVTTTTANAAKVLQHMEFCHQWLWPELDVQLSSVSEQWAQFSDCRPALARRPAQDRRSPARHLECGISVHGGRRNDSHGRRPGSPVPHLLLGRAGLRDRRACGLWRRPDPAHHGSRPRLRDRALRHGGARRHAHREGPCRRQRDQRPDHRARPGPGPDDVDQEGLHRPRHGAAPGPHRCRSADAGRLQAGRIARTGCAPAPISSPRARSLWPPTTRAT